VKQFWPKYRRLFFWLVYLSIALYFAPRQFNNYLDGDVANFKQHSYIPALIFIWLAITGLILLYAIFRLRPLSTATLTVLSVSAMSGMVLFIFQNIILGGLLFVNRIHTGKVVTRTFVVLNVDTTAKNTKKSFLFDYANRDLEIDLGSKLHGPRLNDHDTILIPLRKGILGIPVLESTSTTMVVHSFSSHGNIPVVD
jgi:hypothetical protein